MPLGEYPCFKWKARRIRRDDEEILILQDYADIGTRLLLDDVAIDASVFELVIIACAFQLFDNLARNNRQRDQLTVRMLQGGSGGLAMILEDQHVLQAGVFSEISDAVAKSKERILDLAL